MLAADREAAGREASTSHDGLGVAVKAPQIGVIFATLLLVNTACDLPPPEGAIEVPCETDQGTILEFESVSEVAGRYAQFSTREGTVWVTVQLPAPGGVLPDTDRTNVEVGWADDPPSLNPQTGAAESDALKQVAVLEGLWTPVELEAGDYWFWSSAGGDLTIQSCTQGAIYDPVPATAPSGQSDS